MERRQSTSLIGHDWSTGRWGLIILVGFWYRKPSTSNRGFYFSFASRRCLEPAQQQKDIEEDEAEESCRAVAELPDTRDTTWHNTTQHLQLINFIKNHKRYGHKSEIVLNHDNFISFWHQMTGLKRTREKHRKTRNHSISLLSGKVYDMYTVRILAAYCHSTGEWGDKQESRGRLQGLH
jgi:hypothetical protein